tara:strand:+ start:327 stop:1631 length:1305 start_codon:yes stop_codon:yes gene_type:complete
MSDIKIHEKIFLSIFIFFIFISYIVGFMFSENSAGGAIVDFEFVKRNILAFKNNNFFDAIRLTGGNDQTVFQSTRAPGFYVFNKYLNPFTTNTRFFQGYITIFSLLAPVLLFLSLKIKFGKANIYFLIFISSLILLSPYFRSSAFWGIEENFGIVMVGFTTLFYQLYEKSESKKYELIYLIFLGLFSSLCVYSDQKLIIIPFLSLIAVMFLKKGIYNKLFLVFLYIIFSIPFIYLIKLWGNIAPSGDSLRRNIDILSLNLNYHFIGYSISIVAFYLFPFFFILKDSNKKLLNFLKYKENYLFIFFFIIYLIYFLFYYSLDNFYYIGGGVFQKITKLLFDSLFVQKILLSLIFLFSWILILIFVEKKFFNFLILTILPFLSVFISPALFQEYFDPLIYFLILIYLKKEFYFNLKGCSFIFSYFTLFLFTAIIYYK